MMTIEIQERIEGKRGCGYRKPGGIYLVGPPMGQSCCKLPWPLTVCPCCSAGIKPARSWTWVDPGLLFINKEGLPITCHKIIDLAVACVPWSEASTSIPCPLSQPKQMGMAGLIWIGEKFYKTPSDFLREANTMGISRRISTVPKGFELGRTWVLLAHRKGIPHVHMWDPDNEPEPKQEYDAAIFSVFRPSAIEYVTRGDETEDDLERLAKRGLTPVKICNRIPY